MFKPRFVIQIFFLLLFTGCVSVETATPTTPTLTLVPPTPISILPTSTLPLPVDHAIGLVAFCSDQDGDFEIWVMNADGSNPHQLTNNAAMDLSPSWSPDGNRIAFVSDRDGNDEIYVMNADGRLLASAGYDHQIYLWGLP